MPADFERQSAILLGANELLPHHPQEMVGLVAALVERVALFAVITGESQRRDLLTTLCDWGLPAHRLRCVSSSAIGLWVRDYGPTFVKSLGRVCILDAEYFYPNRPADDRFPSDFARLLGVSVLDVPLLVEGGNILSNGRGLGVCSTALVHRNAGRYAPQQVGELMTKHYGFKALIGVRPLIGGPTPHADMFATFTSPDTIVLGKYDPAHDPDNARQLDEIEKLLLRVTDESSGTHLKIVRIPMPPHGDNIWRTYTNVIYANDVVVVPTYAGVDPGIEREALDIYRRLLPGREIITIEATSLAKTGGVLRCVSLNIPYLGHALGLEDAPDSPVAHWAASLPPGTALLSA
jgi:agmatine/peptidylarginine deiminase